MIKWFKKRLQIVVVDAKREAEVERMNQRKLMCMYAMGFDPDDSVQCWMRQAEILLDHELRLKKLEGF